MVLMQKERPLSVLISRACVCGCKRAVLDFPTGKFVYLVRQKAAQSVGSVRTLGFGGCPGQPKAGDQTRRASAASRHQAAPERSGCGCRARDCQHRPGILPVHFIIATDGKTLVTKREPRKGKAERNTPSAPPSSDTHSDPRVWDGWTPMSAREASCAAGEIAKASGAEGAHLPSWWLSG